MLRVVFFGSGTYTIPIIQILKKHGLQLVVTTENETDPGEKQKTFADYLKTKQITFITSDLKNPEDIEKIRQIKPDLAILASYGVIIKSEIIKLFPQGIINVHPSLLPIYKGASPIQTTILNGDKQTGVTLHYLDEELDHGPIIKQEVYKLKGDETTQDLKNKLFAIGAKMIEDAINKLEKGDLPAGKAGKLETHKQDHSKEVFTKRRFSRADGKIDLNKPPSSEVLKRMIRAFYPWPGVWFETEFMGKKQRVKLLPNNKIQAEGKNVMSFKDFVNGYGKEGKELLVKLNLL